MKGGWALSCSRPPMESDNFRVQRRAGEKWPDPAITVAALTGDWRETFLLEGRGIHEQEQR